MTDNNSRADFFDDSSYLDAEITYVDAEPVVHATRDSDVPFYPIDDDELITSRIFSNDDRFDPNNEEVPEEPNEEEYNDSECEVDHDLGQNSANTSTLVTHEQRPNFLNKNVNELEIGYESEEIEKRHDVNDAGNNAPDYSYYSAPKEISNIRFHVGLKFTTIREARSAVRDYAVGCEYDLSFKKNDSVRIPCPHAIACIRKKREPVEQYVDDCYKPQTFMRIYSGMVNGTNGKEQWLVYDGPDLAPPKQQKKRGRPQIKRRKAPEEAIDKASRRGNKQFCKRCGNSGHNKRTCKVVIDEASSQHDGSVQTSGVSRGTRVDRGGRVQVDRGHNI
ncbi:hypothetical protein ACFE04_031078 [Oxalis oulophora]